MAQTVKTPPQFEAIFDKAEEQVSRFFHDRRDDPTKGTIEISDERFVLVRGAALSVEFFDTVKRLFSYSDQEATDITSQLLFDVAHSLGRSDASHFHKKMRLNDPVGKLAPGPVYFAHAGWAFVDISEESNPEPNENYYLLYDHPYSFEADAWIRAGRRSDFPVCLMNAGYSSGWCEESFGLPLVAVEITCRAMGDKACRFIMAPPDRVEARLLHYLEHVDQRKENVPSAGFWKSFKRDWAREALLEKKLRESVKDHRSLFELSPDAIFVWDMDDIVRDANISAATLLGAQKPDELIGKTWQSVIVPEDLQACNEDLRKIKESGGISEIEFRLQRMDGSILFVQGRARLVLDGAGESRIIAIVRDISGRKRADEALYLSEARFRGAFESAGHGVALVDLDGRFLRVNPAFCRITGYSEEEMLARDFRNITYPDDLAESIESAKRMRNGEISTFEMEKRYIRKDATIVWVQLNVSMVYDKAGKPAHQVTQVQDITARKEAEAALRAQAMHDQLTGLPNRPAFLELLHETFASSRRGAKYFAVLYLDLDGFKDVNDTLGHVEGDRLLQAVAARLKGDVRESDFTARFGGDEFAVLQTGLNDASDAAVLAAKLTESMALPFLISGHELHITISTGISFYDSKIESPEAMLTQADLALYRAKGDGRNKYCFHTPELDSEVHERVALTNELRAALDDNEMELYYQPQVELASGRIVGLEALVRWNHPQRGRLMPDRFIPIAEKTGGSIRALGRWVLDQACRQIKAWRDQGITPPVLAINVSAAELHSAAEFEQYWIECLKRWGVAPGDIEFELTESVLMETTKVRSDALARLKERGANIAIDDFGVGYSSLSYLSAYPVNRLKIAQRFILGIPHNSGDMAITNATLSLARDLGINVIAEGVQTKAQLEFLISAGCTVGQGFYFSDAVQAGRAGELLRRGVIEPK